ncbi:MAG: hypothetical protein H8D67_07745 [Deltaproteobacteria bacterium]|nr:hypothetical protein [Deltaproteobacteria bacterium]
MEKVMSAAFFMSHAPERLPRKTCCGLEERCENPHARLKDLAVKMSFDKGL